MRGSRVAVLAAVVSVGAVGALTLAPSPGTTSNVGASCLACGSFGFADFVLNILLFAPLGFALHRAGLRPLLVLGAGLLLSGSIEALQLQIPGRNPTLRDVATNATGALLGAILSTHITHWIRRPRMAMVLLWASVGSVLLAIRLTGLLLQFAPPPGVYFGQWLPQRGTLELWQGRLHGAVVSGLPVPDGPNASISDTLRASLAEHVVVQLEGTDGPPPSSLSGIFALMTDQRVEALLVGLEGDDLVVRIRRRAADWRLHAPDLRFVKALQGVTSGEALTIEFVGTSREGCATVNGVRSCLPRPDAGSAWMLAMEAPSAARAVELLLGALTFAVLLLPTGILLSGVGRAHRLAAVLALLIGATAAASGAGLAAPMVSEWLAIGCGLIGGWLAGGRLR